MIDRFKGLYQKDSEEEKLLREINKKRLPVHIAIIMDGNGRWAKQFGYKREEGHKKGAQTARKITEYSVRAGIKHLTLFAFSSENWKRPITEVNMLMNMLYDKLVEQKELLIENNIRLNVLGEIDRLPAKLKGKLHETMEFTRSFKKMQINLALNYGGRIEIVNAVKKMIADGVSPSKIDEKKIKKYLYTGDNPDPDLLIRTSGEVRISNFLLYQAAYSELYFTNTMWPDFDLLEFCKALIDFQKRERRFGKV